MSGHQTGHHRPRSPRPSHRDYDQRAPTFQVLDHFHHNIQHPEAKRVEPPPVTHNRPPTKSPVRHDSTPSRNTGSKNSSSGKKSRPATATSPYHPNGNDALSGSSKHSICSGRAPACNFIASQLNASSRSKSSSPKRSRTVHLENYRIADDDTSEEPADVVVWNAGKKVSRSNILCPMTESEIRTAINGKKDKPPSHVRASSVPRSQKSHTRIGLSQSMLYRIMDDTCQTELLEDCRPPTPREASSSVSIASSYDYHIALVTQQLEQIQQAQNDILKQLGDEIAIVHSENERLRQEIQVLRDQNNNLNNVIRDMAEELERMKQIFRTRNLTIPEPPSKSTAEKETKLKQGTNPPSQRTIIMSPMTDHASQHYAHQRYRDQRPGSRDKESSNIYKESQTSPSLHLENQQRCERGENACGIRLHDIIGATKYQPSPNHQNGPRRNHENDSLDSSDNSVLNRPKNGRSSDTTIESDTKSCVKRSGKRSRERRGSASGGPPTKPADSRDKLRAAYKNKDANSNGSANTNTSSMTGTTKISTNTTAAARANKKGTSGGCFNFFRFFWPRTALPKDADATEEDILE